MLLSILSRFYFYFNWHECGCICPDTFNPIKVLFLRKKTPLHIQTAHTFNPIKVLFLRNGQINSVSSTTILSILSRFYFYEIWMGVSVGLVSPFNPIKVLFLHTFVQSTQSSNWDFQSYQGSIFTESWKWVSRWFCCLSILSRFYFYTEKKPGGPLTASLSILSRFYFYKWRRMWERQTGFFQSYQGSIFTSSQHHIPGSDNFFQSYQGSIFTWRWSSTIHFQFYLSILSRFYFYWWLGRV